MVDNKNKGSNIEDNGNEMENIQKKDDVKTKANNNKENIEENIEKQALLYEAEHEHCNHKELSDKEKIAAEELEELKKKRKFASTNELETSEKKENSVKNERETLSENNVSIVTPLKSFSILKAKIESKIKSTSGKICKECFYSSIESHLSTLGIVSKPNKDIDILEEVDDTEENLEKASLLDKENKESPAGGECSKRSEEGFLKSLHRRTLSEIDWHELTKFAQGELFDPESATAKEVRRVIEEGRDELSSAFNLMHHMDFDYVVEQGEKCVQCVVNAGWNVVSHWELPQWLRDNDFLWHMHRPQLPSFKQCFCSMFRVHTETGNIWTHLIGMVLVLISMLFLYLRPATQILGDFPKGWEEYLVFSAFFIGAITCLMFSWLYHTCSCHSKKTSSLFSKLDYTGIACMIMGSMIPSIYFSFYCQFWEKIIYSTVIMVLGLSAIIVALWDKFATPAFRPVRAGLFIALGCSAVIPVGHMLVLHGTDVGLQQGQVIWTSIMGICYIAGALLYALRIPERFFPGKCNLIFQSHQIFHVLVVVAAFMHLHACCEMAAYRIEHGRYCTSPAMYNQQYYNSTIVPAF